MKLLIIDLNLALTISGVIIAVLTIFVTYHLAHRQGVFKKVNLEIHPTLPNFLPPHKKYLKYPWLLVNSCQLPAIKDNKLLFYLPLLIRNSGKTTAENVTITLQFDGAYSTAHLGNDLMYSDLQKHTNMLKRFHAEDLLGGCMTIYELPILQGQSSFHLMEALLFDPHFIKTKVTKLEKEIFKDEKDFAVLKINYQITAKNTVSPCSGHFWILSTQEVEIDKFLQSKKSQIDKLLELTDPNWEKLHKRRYFIPWPYKFFGRVLYRNLGLRYNINLKEIDGYSCIKDNTKKLHAIEAIELSKITWGILTVPFSVGQ